MRLSRFIVTIIFALLAGACERVRKVVSSARQITVRDASIQVGVRDDAHSSILPPAAMDYLRSTHDVLCRVSSLRIRCIHRAQISSDLESDASPNFAESEFGRDASCHGDASTCLHLQAVRRLLISVPAAPDGGIGNQRAAEVREETGTHGCIATSQFVSCSGSTPFGALGTNVNQPDGSELYLSRIPRIIPATLSVWSHATCIGQVPNAVWCWGAFGNPSERVREPLRLGTSTPQLIGTIDGLRQVVITHCGPCALGSHSMRCWHSRDHRVTTATPLDDLGAESATRMIYEDGNDVICLTSQSSIQCREAGARRGCAVGSLEPTSGLISSLPREARSLVATSGFLCVLDSANHAMCAETEAVLAASPFVWKRLAL